MPSTAAGATAALVIAHPGHELRIHGWLELACPKVFILTDGSGRSNRARLSSSTRLLSRIGAEGSSIYGCLTDAEVYAAILDHDFQLFDWLVDELASAFIQDRIEYVVGDALEGYNPAHDLCRVIINATVETVKRRTKYQVKNFDFPLTGAPNNCSPELRGEAIWLKLEKDAFERKLQAARRYPELASEVSAAISNNGVNAFRLECLRPVEDTCLIYKIAEKPFYEQYGEKQVAAGYYQQVLRYSEHFRPMAEAIRYHVEKSTLCSL